MSLDDNSRVCRPIIVNRYFIVHCACPSDRFHWPVAIRLGGGHVGPPLRAFLPKYSSKKFVNYVEKNYS